MVSPSELYCWCWCSSPPVVHLLGIDVIDIFLSGNSVADHFWSNSEKSLISSGHIHISVSLPYILCCDKIFWTCVLLSTIDLCWEQEILGPIIFAFKIIIHHGNLLLSRTSIPIQDVYIAAILFLHWFFFKNDMVTLNLSDMLWLPSTIWLPLLIQDFVLIFWHTWLFLTCVVGIFVSILMWLL